MRAQDVTGTPRRTPRGDFITRNGIIGPGILIGFAVLLVGFWPALAWHGHTATGGWRWDIHSTIGCLIWWAITLGPLIAVVIADARKKRAVK